MRRTSTAIALAMAVAAGPVAAQTMQWTYSDIDADGNLELSEAEFERVSRDIFVRLDADADEALDRNELSGMSDLGLDQSTFDLDADETVDWDEFHAGLFDTYDADRDDALAEQEFAQLGQPQAVGMGGPSIDAGEIVALDTWNYDDLYRGGLSADEFIDELEVYGVGGEEIGDVEDILVGADGRVIAVIAEVGGFWDIGDTHVSIPWDQVEMNAGGDGIVVPITEETVDTYGVYDSEYITRAQAEQEVVGDVDDAWAGNRLWRVSELIGDYARIRDGDAFRNYGYVSDVILRDGEIAAVVVDPDSGYGVSGRRAYPYYGRGWGRGTGTGTGMGTGTGWTPASPYYDMPYLEGDVADMDEFDYDRLGGAG